MIATEGEIGQSASVLRALACALSSSLPGSRYTPTKREKLSMDWLAELDEQDLELSVRRAAGRSFSDTLSIDDLGWELTSHLVRDERGFGAGDQLWDRLKREFAVLVCAKGGTYADIRRKAAEISKSGQTALVAMIAGTLGAQIGISAAAIAPAISLLLLAALRIGREVYCRGVELDMPISSRAAPR